MDFFYTYIKQERIINSRVPITGPDQLGVFYFLSFLHILLANYLKDFEADIYKYIISSKYFKIYF